MGTPSLRLLFILLLASPSLADSIQSTVDQTIKPLIDAGTTPSAVIAVITSDTTRYYSYGHLSASNPAAPTRSTLFEIGSITKTFTGTLLADMIVRKEVRAADPVRTCLPNVKLPTRPNKEITLEHLAEHTSGLVRIPLILSFKSLDDPYADQDELHLYAVLDGIALFSDPGQTSSYSNLGFALLGNALSHKVGIDYETLIIKRICDPLNLPDTRITLTGEQQTRLAPAHRDGQPVPYWHLAAYAPCGGLHSTAADLARYLRANMSLDKSPLTPTLLAAQHPRFLEDPSDGTKIGFAWMTTPLSDTKDSIIWHDGGTGGFSSFIGFSRKHKTGVVILFNTFDSNDSETTAGFQLLESLTTADSSRDAGVSPPSSQPSAQSQNTNHSSTSAQTDK